jgi:hypothetical protein
LKCTWPVQAPGRRGARGRERGRRRGRGGAVAAGAACGAAATGEVVAAATSVPSWRTVLADLGVALEVARQLQHAARQAAAGAQLGAELEAVGDLAAVDEVALARLRLVAEAAADLVLEQAVDGDARLPAVGLDEAAAGQRGGLGGEDAREASVATRKRCWFEDAANASRRPFFARANRDKMSIESNPVGSCL